MKRGITALAPWFGSNRMLAQYVGEEVGKRSIVYVPFAGGMCELAQIDAPTILVSDIHCHVINLATVCRDETLKSQMQSVLRETLFHPLELVAAQQLCLSTPGFSIPSVSMATAYFICVWMSRSGTAGTKSEFSQNLAIRYDAGGGDSVVRFRSATEGLDQFHQTSKRCEFSVEDAFPVIKRAKDNDRTAIYLDPPFFADGKSYKYNCGKTIAEQVEWHTQLKDSVSRFRQTRVVIRYHDNELIRRLYPETEWTWRRLTGRNQANDPESEVLIINGPSLAKGV